MLHIAFLFTDFWIAYLNSLIYLPLGCLVVVFQGLVASQFLFLHIQTCLSICLHYGIKSKCLQAQYCYHFGRITFLMKTSSFSCRQSAMIHFRHILWSHINSTSQQCFKKFNFISLFEQNSSCSSSLDIYPNLLKS